MKDGYSLRNREEGEEFQQTALREVLEESGSRASIIKYVGKSEYTFNVPEDVVEKEVHWYLMMQTVITVSRKEKSILWTPDFTSIMRPIIF